MRGRLFVFAILSMAASAHATIYYISPSGSDGNAGTSEGSPFKTFATAFGAMAAGDELILLDGTYSSAAGTGYINFDGSGGDDCDPCGQPPSGSSLSAMTVVRAKNSGSVTLDGGTREGLFLGRSFRKDSFIKIQGITFQGGGGLYNTSYNTIKNCGFHSTEKSAGSVFGVGTNDGYSNSYNLIEDCWIWGQERVIAINYRADHTVWRRIVVRGDGCDSGSCTGSGNPNVGFSVYESSFVSVQNMVNVDRVLGGGYAYGDFATAQHTSGYELVSNEWLGDLSLHSEDSGFHFESDKVVTNHPTVKNCAAWDSGGNNFNLGSASQSTNDADGFVIESLTAGVAKTSTSAGFRFVDGTNGTLQNLVVYDSLGYNVASNKTPNYTDAAVFGAGKGRYQLQSCTVGCKTSDPTTDGSLKYIARVEDGSALDGTGNGGADYGANVVKRYGTDGTRFGDTDYNALTSTDLWPWPNQARIKSEMCASETRGFCGKSSLTEYIWTYLGSPNPYPDSSSSDPDTSTDTTRPAIVSASAKSVTSVDVTFSESLDRTSAETVGNFSIDNGILVNAASLDSELKTVRLTTSEHAAGTTYTLTVNHVKDIALNAILANSQVQYAIAGPDPLKPSDKHLTGGGSITFGTEADEVKVIDGKGNVIFEARKTGNAPIVWTGKDAGGRTVASGLYICRIRDASGRTVHHPIVMVK